MHTFERHENEINQAEYKPESCVILGVRVRSWKELMLETDFSTTWAKVIFRVKQKVFTSPWCCKSGPRKRTRLLDVAVISKPF